MELDETMCKDPVCQHPQCWGSFQRMERGIPHYRPLGYCQRSPSAEEGGLPVLSVSTMPTPPHSPTNQEAPRWHAVSPVRLAGLSYSALYKLYNKTSSSVAQKVPPNATSHKEPIRPRGVPGHSAIHGPDVAENRATSLVWMPTTPCPKQKKEETLKPLRVGITALTLGTLPCKDAGGDTGDSEVPKVRKKTQVPTGGCPQSLSVSCIQPPGRGPLQGRASGSPAKERALELKGRVSGQHFGSVTLPAPIIPELGNQRVVLHSVKEKHQQGAARLSPVYKLDNQVRVWGSIQPHRTAGIVIEFPIPSNFAIGLHYLFVIAF
ncbi:hypothetical protein XENTR_v10019937 [Xenopus tropicalis]|nr:hypothetical protein XENTR_v10019937 [Xenopus tropicalis]